MCGFSGVFPRRPSAAEPLQARAAAMAAALAARRLMEIDFSLGGAQPMRLACRRYAITDNGELYDDRDQRAAVRAHGVAVPHENDAAVVLAALTPWEVKVALPRFDALFAFAACNGRARVFWLAREHARIKLPPLYKYEDGTILQRGEMRAFEGAGRLTSHIDPKSASLCLRLNDLPAPRSLRARVRHVPPGSLVRVLLIGPSIDTRWFNIVFLARENSCAALSPDEAAEAVDAVLEHSVRRQRVFGVPVGPFLSGGVAPFSLVAAMPRLAPTTTQAFTIGFADSGYDESPQASAVALALGIRHKVLPATEADALSLAADLGHVFDKPFADAPASPTVLLGRFARGHVTVALFGDGGDELFGGDRRHVFAHPHWPRLARVPAVFRRRLAAAFDAISERFSDAVCGGTAGALCRPGETQSKIAPLLGAADLAEAYGRLVVTFPVFKREKNGCSPQVAAWLPGPRHAWARNSLQAGRSHTSGLLNLARRNAEWGLHAAGRAGSAGFAPALIPSAWLRARAAR